MRLPIQSIKKKLDRYVDQPHLSEQDQIGKRTAFYWVLFNTACIVALTLLAYALKVSPIQRYGVTLLIMQVITIIVLGTRINFNISFYLLLYAFILVSAIYVGLMGGILHSGGIILAGMYCVFMSAILRNMKKAVAIVLFYILTMIILFLIDPYLTIHPDMTARNNTIFFSINTIWLSSVQMIFLVYFFKQQERFDETEKRRLRELDETKSRLFTNITHEFRTPITLILGMAEVVRAVDEKSREGLQVIRKNGFRLLRLVNQMLNLSKLEAGLMNVHNVQANVIGFLAFITESLQPATKTRNIQLTFSASHERLLMDFDPDKLEEVMTNLLSNAIRFTGDEGWIKVQVDGNTVLDNEPFLAISVSDNGCGIPADKLDKIFDRFYQAEEHAKNHQEGSGIGLTLVKEQVKLMGGAISVKSQEGFGSQFIVRLPVTNRAPLGEARASAWDSFPLSGPYAGANAVEKWSKPSSSLPVLLIVEDHPDMISYIRSIVEEDYKIITAGDGSQGLQQAARHIPDIIISDVMMPNMDGFAFLNELKASIQTSHIPVVLLTAKADTPSKLEGLELGAEAYLTKPFNREELRIRLRKLLEQRKLLQQRYLSSNLLEQAPDERFRLEDRFMATVHRTLNPHLDDPSFGVDELAHGLGMSRTQLYRKFKALTNSTVDKYIRKYRLHQAMRLLKTTEMNITQVALEVGLPNVAYFSRAFKQEFGHSPSKRYSP